MTLPAHETVQLGKTDIAISPLGVGTWQWGDRYWWGYGRTFGEQDVQAAYRASLENGVNLFDTAELYGFGRSEHLIAGCMRLFGPAAVASKFFPFPWRLRRASLLSALRASLGRLGLGRIDLYQVHWPLPPVPVERWMDAMADAVEAGLIGAVGVSNYSAEQMRRAHQRLAARGIPLASNQVAYSLIERAPERNGVLATARELGVTIIAYAPLGMGSLSGKYSAESPPPGPRRGKYSRARMARLARLLDVLADIGAGRSKTPAQAALNWLICKGAVPIPGAKNAEQATQNAGALGWRLTDEELSALDRTSDAVTS